MKLPCMHELVLFANLATLQAIAYFLSSAMICASLCETENESDYILRYWFLFFHIWR